LTTFDYPNRQGLQKVLAFELQGLRN
jgi:hypothetical protein